MARDPAGLTASTPAEARWEASLTGARPPRLPFMFRPQPGRDTGPTGPTGTAAGRQVPQPRLPLRPPAAQPPPAPPTSGSPAEPDGSAPDLSAAPIAAPGRPATADGPPAPQAPGAGTSAAFDPANPEPAPHDVVRAEFYLAKLAEAAEGGPGAVLRFWRRTAQAPVIRLEDSYVTGELLLRAADLPFLLTFVRCRFQRPVDMRQAKLMGLELDGCWLPGLAARNLRSDSDVRLVHTTCRGEVDLTDAQINGSFAISGSTLANPGGRALQGQRAAVRGALTGVRLTVHGELRIPGLTTGGNVNLNGSTLDNPGGDALHANGARIAGNVLLTTDVIGRDRAPFRATGRVYLPNVAVGSNLVLRGAELGLGHADPESGLPEWGAALVADRAQVAGNVEIDRGFTSDDQVRIVNAVIQGNLRMSRCVLRPRVADETLTPPVAIFLDGTEIHGDLGADRARLSGQLRLVDVHVRGALNLERAEVLASRREAVRANRLEVGGSIEARRLHASGSLIMQGIRTGSNVDFRGARLIDPAQTSAGTDRASLDIRSASVGRDLLCSADGDQTFVAHGGVRLRRAEVGRETSFVGAALGSRLGGIALNAFGLQTQDLLLRPQHPPRGEVDLRHVRCASLDDNALIWDATGVVHLDDFRYDALTAPPAPQDHAALAERLRRLHTAMRSRYAPGPYDQLVTTLRAAGDEEHAARVLQEKQRRSYRATAESRRYLGPVVHLWSWVQRATVGYGYRPARALGWLAAFALAGSMWFATHQLRPINTDDHPAWNPVLYTLDQLLPIVDLGSDDRWAAAGASQWITTGLIAMGWTLATTVAAGVARVLRRS